MMMLGWLLHLANRDMKMSCKEQFYAVKKTLLIKYGTKLGEEIQHIRKECRSCDATGVFKCEWKQREVCFSCNGSGVYEEYWTRLDKYKLGNYSFHNPTKRQYVYNPLFEQIALPIIIGYINHKTPKYRIGTEAMYWLFFIYDFNHFKKMFGTLGYHGNIRTPMVFFANLFFNVRQWKFDWLWKKNNHEPEWMPNDNELPF